MNEEPKSIWKKSRRGIRSYLLAWVAVLVTAPVIFAIFTLATKTPFTHAEFGILLFFEVFVSVLFLLGVFIQWLISIGWRRILFALACFATLIALFYAEEDWRGWHAWNQFKHQWEANGEKIDWQSVVPPPVPDDQNFALTPVVTSCYETYFDKSGHEVKPRNTNVVDRLSMLSWRDISYENQREKVPDSAGWQAAQKMDLKAWQAFFRSPPPTNSTLTNSFPVASQPQSPADDVLLALSKYDMTIAELRQASQLPYSRFPLTYNSEDAFSILLPHLAALKSSALAIRLRSVAEVQKNQMELAAEDAKLGLHLANALRTEPFLISQLVRIAMLDIALQPVWEGLAEHRWSEPQLIALDAELAKIDLLADCRVAQKSELGGAFEEARYLKRHRDYAARFGQMGVRFSGESKFRFSIYRYMPGGWFYQSALKNGRTLMRYFPAVNHDSKTISPDLVRKADAAAKNSASFFDPLDSLKKMINAEYLFTGNFLKQIAASQSYVDLARVAIALERYRLAHGEYPELLDALTPQFIAKVPHDVIGDQPLHYRRTDDGQFVLYSVGWNETDDGGAVVLFGKGLNVNIEKGDWVWRYPKAE